MSSRYKANKLRGITKTATETHITDKVQNFLDSTVKGGLGGLFVSGLGTVAYNSYKNNKLTKNLLRNILLGTTAGVAGGAGMNFSKELLKKDSWKLWKERKQMEKDFMRHQLAEQLVKESNKMKSVSSNLNHYFLDLWRYLAYTNGEQKKQLNTDSVWSRLVDIKHPVDNMSDTELNSVVSEVLKERLLGPYKNKEFIYNKLLKLNPYGLGNDIKNKIFGDVDPMLEVNETINRIRNYV